MKAWESITRKPLMLFRVLSGSGHKSKVFTDEVVRSIHLKEVNVKKTSILWEELF
jgi:hypothetical protein